MTKAGRKICLFVLSAALIFCTLPNFNITPATAEAYSEVIEDFDDAAPPTGITTAGSSNYGWDRLRLGNAGAAYSVKKEYGSSVDNKVLKLEYSFNYQDAYADYIWLNTGSDFSYVVQNGDYLQYDVYLGGDCKSFSGGIGGLELGNKDNFNNGGNRLSTAADQNGVLVKPYDNGERQACDYAQNKWYTRKCRLSDGAGIVGSSNIGILTGIDFDGGDKGAWAPNDSNYHTIKVYYDNIVICSADGTVKDRFFIDGSETILNERYDEWHRGGNATLSVFDWDQITVQQGRFFGQGNESDDTLMINREKIDNELATDVVVNLKDNKKFSADAAKKKINTYQIAIDVLFDTDRPVPEKFAMYFYNDSNNWHGMYFSGSTDGAAGQWKTLYLNYGGTEDPSGTYVALGLACDEMFGGTNTVRCYVNNLRWVSPSAKQLDSCEAADNWSWAPGGSATVEWERTVTTSYDGVANGTVTHKNTYIWWQPSFTCKFGKVYDLTGMKALKVGWVDNIDNDTTPNMKCYDMFKNMSYSRGNSYGLALTSYGSLPTGERGSTINLDTYAQYSLPVKNLAGRSIAEGESVFEFDWSRRGANFDITAVTGFICAAPEGTVAVCFTDISAVFDTDVYPVTHSYNYIIDDCTDYAGWDNSCDHISGDGTKINAWWPLETTVRFSEPKDLKGINSLVIDFTGSIDYGNNFSSLWQRSTDFNLFGIVLTSYPVSDIPKLEQATGLNNHTAWNEWGLRVSAGELAKATSPGCNTYSLDLSAAGENFTIENVTGMAIAAQPGTQDTYILGVYANRTNERTDAEKAAAAAAAMINALPGSDAALTDKSAIEAARSAYDALSDLAKTYVSNIDKLILSEQRIKVLSGTNVYRYTLMGDNIDNWAPYTGDNMEYCTTTKSEGRGSLHFWQNRGVGMYYRFDEPTDLSLATSIEFDLICPSDMPARAKTVRIAFSSKDYVNTDNDHPKGGAWDVEYMDLDMTGFSGITMSQTEFTHVEVAFPTDDATRRGHKGDYDIYSTRKMLIEMLDYDSEGYNHEYIDNICINFKDFKTDAEILAVQNAIQALPKLHLMTISSADDVRAARKLYEALPDEKKARVINIGSLISAEFVTNTALFAVDSAVASNPSATAVSLPLTVSGDSANAGLAGTIHMKVKYDSSKLTLSSNPFTSSLMSGVSVEYNASTAGELDMVIAYDSAIGKGNWGSLNFIVNSDTYKTPQSTDVSVTFEEDCATFEVHPFHPASSAGTVTVPEIMSVTVAWDSLAFSYNATSWDVQNHNWKGNWSTSQNSVIVTNNSNIAVNSDFSFTPVFGSDIGGTLDKTTAVLAKGGGSAVSKLTISSGNQIPFDAKKIGTITVVAKKVTI